MRTLGNEHRSRPALFISCRMQDFFGQYFLKGQFIVCKRLKTYQTFYSVHFTLCLYMSLCVSAGIIMKYGMFNLTNGRSCRDKNIMSLNLEKLVRNVVTALKSYH